MLFRSTAGRLVHRREVTCQDLDFCIDRFGDYLSCWNYSEAPSESKLNLILNPLMQRLGAKGAVIRNINKNSHKSGLFSDQVILGEAPPPEFVVHEFGLKYHVSLTQRQHIGLFLDQRDNRKRVLIESKGKRVLNLFAYTCSFSVCAAAGGCEVVLSVDSAKSALDIGKINFELNELTATGRGKFIVDDVRIFLDRQVRKIQKEGQKALFDIIVCDPPTFSKASNFAAFSVQKEWQDLVLKCAMLCKSDGVVYFSNNHQSESFVAYEKGLKKYFGSVVRLSQPMDFPERQGQDFHVKQFMCKLPLP